MHATLLLHILKKNSMAISFGEEEFLACCGSRKFAKEMAALPLLSCEEAVEAARVIWFNKVFLYTCMGYGYRFIYLNHHNFNSSMHLSLFEESHVINYCRLM